jgi:acyl-CoA thioesterase FadM
VHCLARRDVEQVAARIPERARVAGRIRFSDCDPAGIALFGASFTRTNVAMENLFETMLGVDFRHLHATRRIGRASYATTLHAHRENTELARYRFVNATTALDAAAPIPIPEDLRAALARYAAACESLTA